MPSRVAKRGRAAAANTLGSRAPPRCVATATPAAMVQSAPATLAARPAPLAPPHAAKAPAKAPAEAPAEAPCLEQALQMLGGRRDSVRDILESYPDHWSERVIHTLHRWGARPTLVSVDRVLQVAPMCEAQCTFQAPHGQVLEKVVVSAGRLLMLYEGHADVKRAHQSLTAMA